MSTGDVRPVCCCHLQGHCPCCTKFYISPDRLKKIDEEQDKELHRAADALVNSLFTCGDGAYVINKEDREEVMCK